MPWRSTSGEVGRNGSLGSFALLAGSEKISPVLGFLSVGVIGDGSPLFKAAAGGHEVVVKLLQGYMTSETRVSSPIEQTGV